MMAAGRRIAALTVAVSLTMTGCSSSGLASLPLPHPGPGKDGFSVTAVFENALNVPAFARKSVV